MAKFCLPALETKRFIEAMRTGLISPEKMTSMTSEQRVSLFEDLVGKEFAKPVNALLESKFILKDQKRGMVTWAKQVAGLKPKTRTDLIARINRMEKALDADSHQTFLRDLAEQRLGFAVTFDEAQLITQSARAIEVARSKIKEGVTAPDDPARLDYGLRAHALDEYIKALKKEDIAVKDWLMSPDRWIDDVGGTIKSFKASLDDSFFGRQGLKILFNRPGTWFNAFVKSFGDITKELRGADAMAPVKADIFSRDNALNGKYQAAKFDLGIDFEEAYPSSLPRKIPFFGRLYKASESAFSAGALRMRADYADFMIKEMEANGINTLDPVQMRPMGEFVNSMTGRGHLGRLEGVGHVTNILFFSIKFLKSNIDVLTAPPKLAMMTAGKLMGKQYTAGEIFTRKQAAKATLRIITGMATILAIADAMNPGSVEWDPRSSNFGKIQVGKTRFDVTGGLSALVVLAARLAPTRHKGDWGHWMKSATTDKYSQLLDWEMEGGMLMPKAPKKFGARTLGDVFSDFLTSKFSPLLSIIRDIGRGEHFGGEQVTSKTVARELVAPITFSTWQDLQKPGAAPALAAMLAEILGIGTSTY